MRNITKSVLVGAAVLCGAVALKVLDPGVASAETRLQGTGATFPNPLYQRWVTEYQKAHPDVKIDYQSQGSGAGIKAITEKTVAFAGSDAPMSKAEIEKAGGAEDIIQFPSCAGGVVPAYNVPGVKGDLKFTGSILAQIYLGKISKWNDKALTEINPEAGLPDLAITPVSRADGSGTTYIWTNYLCTQNEDFKGAVGSGKAVKFPVGQGGKGNEGVAATIQGTPGAIGYIEHAYADKNNIAYGAVKNKAGKFIKCTPDAVTAAGEGALDQMNGTILAASIWDQPGDAAYPIGSFTYLIVHKNLDGVQSKEDAQALVDFLWWATHDGQKLAAELDYASLSKGVQAKVETAIRAIGFKGQALAGR